MFKKALKHLARNNDSQHVNLPETQWWTLEELQKLQEFQLRKIVKYPYSHLFGCHKKFSQAGFTLGQICFLGDLQKTLVDIQVPKDAIALMLVKPKFGGIN